jgi:hypothetical protein
MILYRKYYIHINSINSNAILFQILVQNGGPINQSINQSYTLYYSSRRKTEISIVKQDCTQKVNRELTSGVGLQGVHGHKMYWMQRIVTSYMG